MAGIIGHFRRNPRPFRCIRLHKVAILYFFALDFFALDFANAFLSLGVLESIVNVSNKFCLKFIS